jgi:hypothetical protein
MKSFTTLGFVVLLFLSSTLVAQNVNSQNMNDVVHGIVYHGNQQYLVTDNGYIKVENKQKSVNDQWTEYYRKAYGDSTIQNPNTIIEQPRLNIPIQFFFPVGRNWIDKEYEFNEDAYLYDFLEHDGNGSYTFRPGIIGIIGSRLKGK